MRLIDDIDAAAEQGSHAYCRSADWEAYVLTSSPWWPRIKAALEAGAEMADYISEPPCDGLGPNGACAVCAMVERFREVTEGAK